MSAVFESHVPEALDELKKKKARALEVCGGTVERYAKENLAKNKSVISGNLRNGVTHEMKDENTVVIGSGVKYAPYVELGHSQEPGRYVPKLGKRLVASYVPGKPYLRPAVEGHIDELKDIIERIMGGN